MILLNTPLGLRAAEIHAADEYVVKAAFLYGFAKFVSWPSESFPADSTSLNICILGDAPIGSALDTISDKTIDGRPVKTKQFDDLGAISTCQILFVSASESERLKPIVEAARKYHVLTVSDMEGFDHAGGMIRLFAVGKNLRFSINQEASRLAGLKISSKLLTLSIDDN